MRSATFTILVVAACAALMSTYHAAVPMDYLHANGLLGATILPLTQGIVDRFACQCRYYRGASLDSHLASRANGVVAGTPLSLSSLLRPARRCIFSRSTARIIGYFWTKGQGQFTLAVVFNTVSHWTLLTCSQA
jgi:hypothetical protein